MDVRAFGSWTSAQKTSFSCALSDGVKVFGSGSPPGYPPGRQWVILPKNFMFRPLLHSLTVCKLGVLYMARLLKVHFSGDFLGGVFDLLRSTCFLATPIENREIS